MKDPMLADDAPCKRCRIMPGRPAATPVRRHDDRAAEVHADRFVKGEESAIFCRLMRIDAHPAFLAITSRHSCPWIGDAMHVLRRDFLPDDLRPLLQSIGFDGSIAVQTQSSTAETDWLLTLADGHDFIRGVVGWVDLRSPDVDGELRRFAMNPKFVGVRHALQDETDPGFMLRPEFLRGIERLNNFGLTFDLLLYPQHLPAAAELAAPVSPTSGSCSDHLGKPCVAETPHEPVARTAVAAGRKPERVLQIVGDGHGSELGPMGSPKSSSLTSMPPSRPFGVDRLMIGSDWPVLHGRC